MAPYLQRFGDFKRENAFHEAEGKGYTSRTVGIHRHQIYSLSWDAHCSLLIWSQKGTGGTELAKGDKSTMFTSSVLTYKEEKTVKNQKEHGAGTWIRLRRAMHICLNIICFLFLNLLSVL